MKINVSKPGRYHSALWRPFLPRTYYPILHHPRLEEPPDDSEKTRIGDSMLQELHHMEVGNYLWTFRWDLCLKCSILVGNQQNKISGRTQRWPCLLKEVPTRTISLRSTNWQNS